MYNILFVCMGNICRSPAAEGFFRHALAASDLAGRVAADSAGTHGYHVGQGPDPRAVTAAARYGVDMSGIVSRRIAAEDFGRFDLILAMDEGNLRHLRWLQDNEARPGRVAEMRLMMEFSPRYPVIREVMDPYYGGARDFDAMCELLAEATQGLVDEAGRRLRAASLADRDG